MRGAVSGVAMSSAFVFAVVCASQSRAEGSAIDSRFVVAAVLLEQAAPAGAQPSQVAPPPRRLDTESPWPTSNPVVRVLAPRSARVVLDLDYPWPVTQRPVKPSAEPQAAKRIVLDSANPWSAAETPSAAYPPPAAPSVPTGRFEPVPEPKQAAPPPGERKVPTGTFPLPP